MKHLSTGSVTVVRLDAGEDLLEGLCAALKESYVAGAAVLTGIGTFTDADLGTNMGKGAYRRRTVEGPLALVALSGLITAASSAGPHAPHLHASFADAQSGAWGGHLFGAQVGGTAEVVLLPIHDSRLKRAPSLALGLDILDI